MRRYGSVECTEVAFPTSDISPNVLASIETAGSVVAIEPSAGRSKRAKDVRIVGETSRRWSACLH